MRVPAPTITRTRPELAAALDALDAAGRSRALVMTMGALHAGHLTLVREARRHADAVVVSVYVNPLQFGPGEDFDAYPRDLDADVALLAAEGVDVVFAPDDATMYPGWPDAPAIRIDPGPLAARYEGATRPGHFAGVAQVVAKVINLVRPVVAVFGQKDAQQLALVRSLVRDLDLPGRIVAVPVSRDDDGLARSSRNSYLAPVERERALTLSRALRAGERAAAAGAGPREVHAAAWAELTDLTDLAAAGLVDVPFAIDYLALVDATTFAPLVEAFGAGPDGEGGEGDEDPRTEAAGAGATIDAVLAVAVRVGSTRLIDNLPLRIPRAAAEEEVTA